MADERPLIVSTPAEVSHAPAAPSDTSVDPCAIVVFGASGDMTSRLLVPALYNLCRTGSLPKSFAVIGVARSEMDAQAWRTELRAHLDKAIGTVDDAIWSRLADTMSYVPGDVTDAALYEKLRGVLDETAQKHGTQGNVIFYLAVADKFFGPIIDNLGHAKLTREAANKDGKHAWRRVVVEKPFGHDYDSARALDKRIARTLHENQIFRIDHFLGKDAVQSIMAFRFANGLFEPIWSRDRIDHVQITVAETVGVETRGDFYEQTGALRDMVPNHVFALLSMVAMEPPVGFDEASIRSKKADVFAAMPALDPKNVVRGQYGAGTIKGKPVKAYRDEANVAPDSKVETFVAMKLEIDNWRWAGVPFFVRTGKHMSDRHTEIAICFKQAPYTAFQNTPVESLRPNWLALGIQPNEGISLQFEVKRRGPAVELAAVKMDFRYDDWFPKEPNVGYETLIHDVITGDQTLFIRADMVEQGWRIVQPVIDAWAAGKGDLAIYESGSEGPKEAEALLGAGPHRVWRPVQAPQSGTR